MNLNVLIEHKKSQMTKSQLALAEFVTENLHDVGFMTYSELSKRTGVSEASIIRFFRFLGLNSVSEFKELLKETIKQKPSPVIRLKETVTQIEDKQDVCKNLLNIDIAMIYEIEENLSESNLKEAVHIIRKARRIYIIGFGISRGIVDFLDFRLNRLNYPSVPVTTGGAEIVEQLFSATRDDVLIAIGFFRPHREINIAFEIAKKQGIPIVAITDSFSSPLAEDADIVLHARRGPKEFLTSLVAPMAVANILTIMIALENKEKSIASYTELEGMKEKYKL
ncbi:MAG: MurR/RpiR family transcriptional regulator [Spirochaetaceae bacterium]|nr:MurR/RpiR family transcriptional regulator [Spirochaetaceae bacterium]